MSQGNAAFKALLLDGIDPAGVEVIAETGSIVPIVHDKIDRAALLDIVGDADGLIVRSATLVDKELIARAPRLRVVGRAGVGIDNVDLDAATDRGILVMNSPGGSTTTTAEHAIAMLFALARSIPQAYVTLKNHKWDKGRFKGVELAGKTAGVVGLGRIGSEVARKLQAMGMRVVAYDPFISRGTTLASGVECVDIGRVLEQSDFITFHVPLTDATRDMVNAETISKMKDGVRLINCSRGGVINEKDLYDALKSGRVAGAALDVFDVEPNTTSPLLELDNFIATPHLGASTVEAQRKVSEDICRQVADYLLNRTVSGALNFPQIDAAQVERNRHFVDLATSLASFIGQITDGPIQSVGIQYSGEVSEMNLNYLNAVILQRLLKPMLGAGVNLVNARRMAEARGIQVRDTRNPVPENFTNLVTIILKTDKEERHVSGTVFKDKQPRIVEIDGYALEVMPRGNMILFTNNDKPGVVGAIGTTLGECKVNIAGMTLARERQGGHALALLLVDGPVGHDVLERLLRIENIVTAKSLRV
jgi:D-3-phosphoglycerate dehydrogenase